MQRIERISVGDKRLEYAWHGPAADKAPTLAFLHEGLGCVAMWRDFPAMLAEKTGCGALVYSRAGYGKSDRATLPRPFRFMHDEALKTLPAVLEAFNVERAVLVGHSDGGSIALIYAGAQQDSRIKGLILEAPHVFVEEFGLRSIRALRDDYRHGPLRERLQRYHGEQVDETFWGWNDVWLGPDFKEWNIGEYLGRIDIPVLLIQGADDQYGTMDQVRAIENGCKGPVETIVLSDCGHTPHSDRVETVLHKMAGFVQSKRPGSNWRP